MSYIKFTRHPYEEPYNINLVLEASNGSQKTVFEYYCSASDLKKISTSLLVFPRHGTDVYLYEFGSERPEDKWSYYFRMRVFTTNGVGGCAIQIRTNNNQDLPDREVSEFCIKAESSQINRLAKLIGDFGNLQHDTLEWNVVDGALIESGEKLDKSV